MNVINTKKSKKLVPLYVSNLSEYNIKKSRTLFPVVFNA